MQKVDKRIEEWKKKLLDLGKRNRMINFKETKRSNLNIISPSITEVYNNIVKQEKELAFSYPIETGDVIERNIFKNIDENKEVDVVVISGDIETNQEVLEEQKTLKALRNKAKTSIEEQGVNTLYLAFGFLTWKENMQSSQVFKSPIVLVPISLTVESLTSPYKISLHDDEIVVNPTLKYKLENDFNIVLPEFDSEEDDITLYLKNIQEIVKVNNWKIIDDVSLSIFSFLKINMYKDLHNNNDILKNNFSIKALSGDVSEILQIPKELQDYNHDKSDRPMDIHQVVDADSSQQDAIMLSKKGISFVLQGPPGTGKSQTITNIISEALADGKKVLFVSEKMAALEVVYKRLSTSGLSDFCLTLHNHKANKKQILADLENSLNIDRIKLKDDILYELEIMSKERENLNKYTEQLHYRHKSLDKTIFEANGITAKLKDAPNVLFSFENIENITTKQLINYEYLINNFSKTIGKLTEDYDVNVWKGSNVEQVTHELRHNIETKSKTIISLFKEFLSINNTKFKDVGLKDEISFSKLHSYVDLLKVCERAYNIPIEWLESDNISEVSKLFLTFSNLQEKYNKISGLVNKDFTSSIFEIDGVKLEQDIENLFSRIEEIINKKVYFSRKRIFEEFDGIKYFCKIGIEELLVIDSCINNINKIFNNVEISNFKDLENIRPILIDLNKPIKATEKWFDNEEKSKILNFCKDLECDISEISKRKDKILNDYDKGILDIDFEAMLNRFKVEYTGFFKIFKANYKEDVKNIRILKTIPVKKLTDIEIITLLNDIKKLREKEIEFSNKKNYSKALLGDLYNGINTDFSQIECNLELFNKIDDYFVKNIPCNIKNIILSGENENSFNLEIEILNKIENSSNFKNIGQVINIKELEITEFLELKRLLEDLHKDIDALKNEYNSIIKNLTNDLIFEDINNGITNLITVQSTLNELNENQVCFENSFRFLYSGIESDSEKLGNTIDWAKEFRNYIDSNNLNNELIEKVISLNYTSEFNILINNINNLITISESDFNWLNNLYSKEYQMYDMTIENTISKLNNCIANLYGLEEWIDFKNAREQCSKNGLDEFVEIVLNNKIAPELITDSFKKRFYKLWLDKILQISPSVQQFRRKNHEELIERFKYADLKQLKIAQLRIKENLISKLPDLNKVTSSLDEVGVLKRELSKQRKIMPIRKLFAKIPTLLPTLKPCLMMSPLSVSLFLESDLYKFDLVIFDEASQVCTENAIGALMRSKQVIVAGDNKQLPPTSFFATSSSDDDYDVDVESDEEADDGEYESILDEMLTVLPERSLKWHYRSKHEQLITFSNVKIYNQSLITFPSTAENIKDNGVEYVFVENGVYDRGGKKNNINEAKQVAKMVFEHFRNFNNRSLGVITFSMAQQQAIDDEIINLRKSNPSYEHFFSEEKTDAFFVKNLENVQGDERDTIIVSIGYAKDEKGQMYMNFGPLNRVEGYRRLNVAITRAKYNLKLVGSIRPTDINIKESSSEGLKMIRSYIEFAINGKVALENELKVSEFIEVDSPFEEAIYDFLVMKGYKVSTQVGCSGYRIDMAIHHPTLDGRFVIGIECDGATYHSSRTARERDRLRQTVLEDMGWKFHRIWSTDWIKDPITEGELLINAIERAVEEYVDNFEVLSSNKEDIVEDSVKDYYETQEHYISLEQESNFSFEPYIEANPHSVIGVDYGVQDICNAISYIIEVEYPIHYELLCKRMASLFGNQKVTIKIRDNVDFGLKRIGESIARKGDFFYPISYGAIVPKSCSDDGYIRPINYISDDEIEEAIYLIVSSSFGLTKSGLFQSIAKEFGFNRTGANINNTFERVLEQLIKTKQVAIIDDKVGLLNIDTN